MQVAKNNKQQNKSINPALKFRVYCINIDILESHLQYLNNKVCNGGCYFSEVDTFNQRFISQAAHLIFRLEIKTANIN